MYEQKEREQARYAAAERQQAGALDKCEALRNYSSDGIGPAFPRRISLRQRADEVLAQVEQQYRRAGAAQRVKEILDKHPEFGELLDLISEF